MARFGCTVTVDTGKMPSSQTNFSWLLTEDNFPTAAIDGGDDSIDNGGGNLRCYTDDTKTTQLAIEVVSFVTGGTPVVQVWGLSATLDVADTVYIEADTVETAQPAVTDTYGRNAVWVDYVVVVHGDTSTDSTGDHSFSATGTPTIVSGKIGNALNVNEDNYYSSSPSSELQTLTEGSFSVQTWIKYETETFSSKGGIIGQALSSSGNWWSFGLNLDLSFITTDDNVTRKESSGGFDMDSDGTKDTWYLLSVNIDTTVDYELFTDSSLQSTTAPASGGCESTKDIAIGGPQIVTGGSQVIQLDEIRVGAIRTADYIESDYNNQNAPDTFWTTSAWEDQDDGGSTTPKSLSYTGVSTASLATVITYTVTGSATASGSATIVKLISKILATVGIGSAAITKKASKTLATTATGTASEQDSLILPQAANSGATGMLSSVQTFIAGTGAILINLVKRIAIRCGLGL